MRNMFLLFVVHTMVIALLASTSCSQKSEPTMKAQPVAPVEVTSKSDLALEPDLDLYELSFREILPKKETKEGVLLAIAIDRERDKWKDPDKALIKRLADMPYRIRGVSQIAPPGSEDKHPIRDSSGREVKVYYVIIREKTKDRITLEVGHFGGALDGSSFEIQASKIEGTWQIIQRGTYRIS